MPGGGGKNKKAASTAKKAQAEEMRQEARLKREEEDAAVAAAVERMREAAWHPSTFERGKWMCCGREDLDDVGCYTHDDTHGNIISWPLRTVHGRYQ